jgi:hypothetical protein
MCWTQPYTRLWTTTNKTNNTTLYVLDTTIHKTERRKTRHITQHYMWCCVICLVCRRPVSCVWLCPTHIVLCYLSCLLSSCVLCMVVSNSYSVVLFVLLQITQHYMCWTQPYTRHRTTTNKTNNTTLYVLDTTIHNTQDDDKQDK